MVQITPIAPQHNFEMAAIIRDSLQEFDIDLNGTVFVDPYLDDMYTHFSVAGKAYFVATENGQVLGGSGLAPLDDIDMETCELQRMFVKKMARGKGIGQLLMDKCLTSAKAMGFKACYLETFADMHDAIKLYERNNFRYLSQAMGNTGHYACKTWMIRQL